MDVPDFSDSNGWRKKQCWDKWMEWSTDELPALKAKMERPEVSIHRSFFRVKYDAHIIDKHFFLQRIFKAPSPSSLQISVIGNKKVSPDAESILKGSVPKSFESAIITLRQQQPQETTNTKVITKFRKSCVQMFSNAFHWTVLILKGRERQRLRSQTNDFRDT
ncbi:hypothetical protein AVEN_211070-1 [Araneus ventricosus]|uniref:Uncharacterized protein n=1 Tax=Araneus ventricosus TaxID=182803 RepID=A0A4Y2N8C8_ARAVE|nr:hypothetical protein AVEN_211070-1 [Araneus ventricosus]